MLRPLSLIGLFGVALLVSSAFAQTASGQRAVEGKARIVDGDTLEIGIHRVDLYGVDAPEPAQQCQRDGKPWRCGVEATYAMAALLEFNWLTCRRADTAAAVTIVAVCHIGGPSGFSVNQEIVRRGWALASPSTGAEYVGAEQEARAAGVGLWSGSFIAPWEWRRTEETGKKGN